MRRITLAYALKEKKRIVTKLHKYTQMIRVHNLRYEDMKQKVDLAEIYEKYQEEQKHLIELKQAIAVANTSHEIFPRIIAMEELKSEHAMWNVVSTNDDPDINYGPDGTQIVRNKVCQFDRNFVEQIKEKIQNKLDELQDEIDSLNATTYIDLSYD